jgi:hypothetical protein
VIGSTRHGPVETDNDRDERKNMEGRIHSPSSTKITQAQAPESKAKETRLKRLISRFRGGRKLPADDHELGELSHA